MPRYARPSRPTRLYYRTTGHVVAIKIDGERIDQSYAVVMYRCKVCLGRLRKRDAGLACLCDEDHRGYIHKKEAAEAIEALAEKQAKIEAVYEVVDGIIKVKEQ